MTRPISVRARPSLIAAMDARAAALGQDRSAYILSLVERDLAAQGAEARHRFGSEDLIGSVQSGVASGDNATVRRIVRERLREKHR